VIFSEYDRAAAPPAGATLRREQTAPEPVDAPFPEAPSRRADAAAFVAERGHPVRGPFLAFWEAYGQALCGLPVSGELLIDGVRTQVFDNLVLREPSPGRVEPAPMGAAWLALSRATAGTRHDLGQPIVVDLVGQLPTAAGAAYPVRTLADIRYLVVHHTGAPIEVGPSEIAAEHVEALGWPGIGYHYVVGADGTAWRTQDLTAISHHARQFNPVAAGIALAGDLSEADPPPAQLAGAAALLADLLDRLGLPLEAVRGHGEVVPTPCPGAAFARWKPELLDAVRRARTGGAGVPAAGAP